MKGLWRLAVLLFVLSAAGQAVAAEVIESFDSDVRVAKDGDLTVTETLHVHAEGNAMRHGVYRDFPLTFRDAGGRLREVTFHLLAVSRDGHPEPYHTERANGSIRIYAGDKNVLLKPGEHSYVFEYRSGRQVRWFAGKPELDWNVTGNFWNFPIEAVTYHLHLVDGAAPLRWTAYSGRPGARGTDWRGGILAGGTLAVSTTRSLAPGEGLTVVAALPASAVQPPSANTLLWYALFDNRQWIIGGIGFLAVLIYYFAAWEAFGRDPKPGVIIPLFHPPRGVSPALANYIHNWGLSREKWRAFTAAALSLAVRNLIVLDRSGGALTLKAAGSDLQRQTPLPAEERAIVTGLSTNGGTIVIDRNDAQTVADLVAKFKAAVVSGNHNRFFRRNLGYVIAGAAMTAAVIAAIVIFGGLQDPDIGILFAMGLGGFWLGAFSLPVLQFLYGRGAKFATLVRFAVFTAIATLFLSIAVNFAQALLSALGEAVPVLVLGGLFVGLFTVVAVQWQPLRSLFGPSAKFVARVQLAVLAAFAAIFLLIAINFAHPLLSVTGALVEGYPFPFVLVTAFAALNGIFLYLMKAPTALGRPIMDQLEGLRLYLKTAESDRLNMHAPEITRDRFEALLPYAVALDVEKPWADAFAAALHRAEPTQRYQPSWYSGGDWSSGDFGDTVASTVGGVSDAMAAAMPVSSGSSGFSDGGGGSGGGGGGGGGGGW